MTVSAENNGILRIYPRIGEIACGSERENKGEQGECKRAVAGEKDRFIDFCETKNPIKKQEHLKKKWDIIRKRE